MLEHFMEELRSALGRAGLSDEKIDAVAADYSAKYDTLSAAGKSDFEIMVYFGDPEEIALEYPGQKLTHEEKLLRNPLITEALATPPKTERADTQEEADDPLKLLMEKPDEAKQPPKAGVKVYIGFVVVLFSLVMAAFAVVTGLIAYTAGLWLVLSFTSFEGNSVAAFFIALATLALAALFGFIIYKMIRYLIRFVKDNLSGVNTK